MEPVLPNRLRYPVIRDDVWTIDHISCMLSDASRRLLEDILGPHVGYINPNGSFRPMCVTVAYSRTLIEHFWFMRQHDLDDFMEFDTRKRPIVVPLEEVTVDNVTDKHGIQHGSLILNSSKFDQERMFYISNKGASWDEGDYIPHLVIKKEEPFTEDELSDIRYGLSNNSDASLVFDRMRYMRFAELKPIMETTRHG